MSKCIDRHFEKMLHHYELGILPDDDREAFELHLYRCDHCLNKVMAFEETSRLLREDADVKQAYQEAAAPSSETPHLQPIGAGRTGLQRRLLYSSLAAAAVIVLALVGSLIIEEDEVVAADNRLAIIYFNNLVNAEDPEHVGDIIANLLIADLNESQYMQTVTSQRLQDILNLQGVENTRNLDNATAGDVSRQARARWMLTGNILQEEPQLIITSQLVDVTNGTILASQRVMAEAEESLFAVADRLSSQIKADLPLPSSALDEPDRNVSDVTTVSDKAYWAYLKGVEYYNKYYYSEATTALIRAVQHDSTFAMAYYYLSFNDRATHIEQAMRYLHHAGKKDQLFILSRHEQIMGNLSAAAEKLESIIKTYPDEKDAYLNLARIRKYQGRPDEARDVFHEAIELDPHFKTAYNELAYLHAETGDCDRALETIDQYAEVAPYEANPYDSRGDILSQCGRYGDAIESYRRALEIKPDFFHPLAALAKVYLLTRQYDAAHEIYASLANCDHPDGRSYGRYGLALVPLFRGRFEKALTAFQKGIDADHSEEELSAIPGCVADKHLMRSHIYRELGLFDEALEELNHCLKCGLGLSADAGTAAAISIMARRGDFQKASRMAEEFRDALEKDRPDRIVYYQRAAGHIHFFQGTYDQAIQLFRQADPAARHRTTQYYLGQALLEGGQPESALTAFKKVHQLYASYMASNGIMYTKSIYYMARAHEMLGDKKAAAKLYDSFLNRWNQADEGIPEIEDARKRLDTLSS